MIVIPHSPRYSPTEKRGRFAVQKSDKISGCFEYLWRGGKGKSKLTISIGMMIIITSTTISKQNCNDSLKFAKNQCYIISHRAFLNTQNNKK
jgi:hypothetical protein